MRLFLRAVTVTGACCWLSFALSDAANAATYKLSVLSPDGAPVAGATVWASPFGGTQFSEKDGSLRRLVTDEKGLLTVEFPDQPTVESRLLARVQSDKFAVQDFVMKPGEKTVSLLAPKKVRGTVKTAAGAPVADATVRVMFAPGSINFFEENLFGDGGVTTFLSLLSWGSSLPPLEARTGADGKWTIDNVKVVILNLADKRFASAQGFAGIPGAPGGEGDVALVAKPAAGVKGRITTPDGKPLANVMVMNVSDGLNLPVRTNAEGVFVLEGVAAGPVMLIGFSNDPDWLMAPHNSKITAVAGKTIDLPEWKATRGMEITGTIVDKATGTPIAGAKISTMTGNVAVSGADGKFKTRSTPDQVFLSINHENYAPFWKNFDKNNGAALDAGRIALDRSWNIKGRLIDENGAPVPGLTISAFVKNGDMQGGASATSGKDGAFSIRVAAGNASFALQAEGWELLKTPTKIDISEKTGAIELKARKLKARKVQGRVLTTSGKPASGVTVTIFGERPKPKNAGDEEFIAMPGSAPKNVETDAEGRFSAEMMGDFKTLLVTDVKGENLLVRKAGQGKLKDDVWTIGDTTVALLNAKVSGRVLDINGAPLAGALVASPEAATFAPVKTDAEGRFTLAKLPEGEAVVLAAINREAARETVRTGEEVELRIAPPGVFLAPMRRQFFEGLNKNSPYEILNYWDALGTEKMLALALQKDGALPAGEFDLAQAKWEKAGSYTLQGLGQMPSRDAAWLLANGAAVLAKIPADVKTDDKNPQARLEAQSAFAIVAALKGDAAAREAAAAWLAQEQKEKDAPKDNLKNATNLFRLAGVAGALKRPDAKALTLAALNYSEQAGEKTTRDNAERWGGLLAPGGVELFGVLDGEWPLNARLMALKGAVKTLAPLDLAAAKVLLDRLEKLSEQPAEKPKPDAPKPDEAHAEPQLSFVAEAKDSWRRAQAKADPAAALAWMKETKETNYQWRLIVARAALRAGNKTMALDALQPLAEVDYLPAGVTALLGVVSLNAGDKTLAEQFLAKAKASAAERNENSYQTVANYAFYLASIDPAQARLTLEDLWQRSLPPGGDPQNAKAEDWQKSVSRSRVAGAMIAIDPLRALELMGHVGQDYHQFWTRARIAAYLLADEKERPLLGDGE